MGLMDFAGSTIVHSIGACVSLAGLMVVGPRIGKYQEDGSIKDKEGITFSPSFSTNHQSGKNFVSKSLSLF
jgi:Amt family ammonium transporter